MFNRLLGFGLLLWMIYQDPMTVRVFFFSFFFNWQEMWYHRFENVYCSVSMHQGKNRIFFLFISSDLLDIGQVDCGCGVQE